MQLSLPKQLLIVLCLLHLFINVIWLAQNFAPLQWDQAGHTRIAVRMSQYFLDQLPGDETAQFLTISNYYPPLIHAVAAGFISVFGKHIFVSSLPITLFFLLLLWGIFKLNSLLFNNEWIGLISATLFSLLPAIYTNSRWFLLEIPMLAFLVWALIFLKKSNYFGDWKYTLLFSLTTGLLLLTKWIGIIFLIIPYSFALCQAYKNKNSFQSIFTNIALGALLVFLMTIPWYAANFDNLFSIGSQALVGEESDPQILLSLENIFFYLHHFINFQVTVWPALGLLVAGIVYFAIPNAPYKKLFAATLVVYYLLFTFISNKDIRYTFPLLLVPTSMAGYVALHWHKRKKTLALSAFSLSIFPLVIYFFGLSFGLLPQYQAAWNLTPLGWVDYINTTDVVVQHPKKNNTPIKIILADLDRHRGDEHVFVYIGVDQAEVNPATFDLYQVLGDHTSLSLPKLPFNQSQFETEQDLLAFIAQFQFFVLPDAKVGTPASRNKIAMEQIRDYILREHLDDYTILREYPSPRPEGKIVLVIPNAE